MLENLPSIVFYVLAAALVLSAIAVVVLPSIFYSAVALGAGLTVMAGIFVLFGADFLGVAQILVYVGGVMIIMLFVIMLSPQTRDNFQKHSLNQSLRGILLALASAVSLLQGFQVFAGMGDSVRDMVPTSAGLGRLLLGDLLLPFEAISLILLVALVGAALFGQDKLS
jgi:NADH:ubiquinone oxidoreductase subunit 6 (subunit J)